MSQVATIFLVVVIIISFIKVFVDWSKFERKVRHTNQLDTKEVRKIAVRIGIVSLITGLSMGLAAVIVRQSSPSIPPQEITIILYLVYILSCTLGWPLLVITAFALKVITLRSLHRERPPE